MGHPQNIPRSGAVSSGQCWRLSHAHPHLLCDADLHLLCNVGMPMVCCWLLNSYVSALSFCLSEGVGTFLCLVASPAPLHLSSCLWQYTAVCT